MSTVQSPPSSNETFAADHGRPTFGSLVRAELLRIRSRRLLLAALALGLGVMLLGAIGAFVGSGEPSASDLASAERLAAESEAQCRQSLEAEEVPLSQADIDQSCEQDPAWFVSKEPWTWAAGYREGVLGVAGGFAALLFLVGASLGGAEWASRTMPALLYWEPRRLRVMGAKVVALASVAAVVAVAAQMIWFALSFVLEATRGASEPPPLPDDFVAETVALIGPGVLLAVLTALLAFGLANLTRNTAAALGVGFVYFAIIESILGGLRPGLLRWLVGPNVGAFLTPGGLEFPAGPPERGVDGLFVEEVIRISNLRAGLWLFVIVAVVLAVATVLFRRRDVS